ncbi:MAG: MgtC/SapB family protein [Candidatus Asgardarchaeia archaeon]
MQVFLSKEVAIKILVGFAVGAIIGLERQKWKEEQPLGLRSFGLISLFGTIDVIIYTQLHEIAIFYFAIGFVMFLVGMYTIYRFWKTAEYGLTTSISFTIAFFLGVLVGLDNGLNNALPLAVTVSIFTTFVLSMKGEFTKFIRELTPEELTSALELGILLMLIYPLIPSGVTDPIFHTIDLQTFYFLMIVLLLIMFGNYVLIKKFAYEGIILFSILGGLVNSEATIVSLGRYYDEIKDEFKGYVRIGILLANVSMLGRNIFVAAILDPTPEKIVVRFILIPLGIFMIVGIVVALITFTAIKVDSKGFKAPEIETPFSLFTAAKFVIIFASVTFLSVLLEAVFSVYGIYAAGIIGGFANAGAVTLASVTLFAVGKVSAQDAAISIVLANLSAVANKIIYAKLSKIEHRIIRKIEIDALVFMVIVIIFIFLLITNSLSFLTSL